MTLALLQNRSDQLLLSTQIVKNQDPVLKLLIFAVQPT